MILRLFLYSAIAIGGTDVAQAEGHLEATLMQADTGHPTKLVLTLTNDGDRPLAFEEFTTPLVLLDDVHTSYMQFDVVDVDAPHAQAPYRGYFVHNLGHPEENYVTFQPGESRVAHYDLAADYKLARGKTYRVTFHMHVGQAPEDRQGLALPTRLSIPSREKVLSNTVIIAVSPYASIPSGVKE